MAVLAGLKAIGKAAPMLGIGAGAVVAAGTAHNTLKNSRDSVNRAAARKKLQQAFNEKHGPNAPKVNQKTLAADRAELVRQLEALEGKPK